jgi:hypothetical protein
LYVRASCGRALLCAGAGAAFHRGVRRPVARRVFAAGDQGTEARREERLAIKFEERTPDAYTAQFNSGEFQLGGSATLLTVGLADARGVKVTYLFDLWGRWSPRGPTSRS